MKDASIVNSPELKFLNLSSLRDLQLDEPEYELEHRPTPLSIIFSVAPNLEKARIKGTVSHFFAVEDLKVVTSMIVDGSFLRNLQKLHILLRAVSSTDCVTTNQQIPDENIKGSKIRFSGNSKGNILPTDTDSIFERHRFQDFLGAFQ
ncbi:Hypothetical predicted protein [Cloeon dipterum]|uniref:Uncharacterized protein n=1 Tax=Cloeon dipterum TaxID=197152 RepID=A0A8S1E3N5_9INSE|nr:Hypothetical predicted protein [Cloeon dipterum]